MSLDCKSTTYACLLDPNPSACAASHKKKTSTIAGGGPRWVIHKHQGKIHHWEPFMGWASVSRIWRLSRVTCRVRWVVLGRRRVPSWGGLDGSVVSLLGSLVLEKKKSFSAEYVRNCLICPVYIIQSPTALLAAKLIIPHRTSPNEYASLHCWNSHHFWSWWPSSIFTSSQPAK